MFKVSKKKQYQNNMSHIFKVNNNDTRTASDADIWRYFARYSTVNIAEFEQINTFETEKK